MRDLSEFAFNAFTDRPNAGVGSLVVSSQIIQSRCQCGTLQEVGGCRGGRVCVSCEEASKWLGVPPVSGNGLL